MFLCFRASDSAPGFHVRWRNLFKSFAAAEIFAVKPHSPELWTHVLCWIPLCCPSGLMRTCHSWGCPCQMIHVEESPEQLSQEAQGGTRSHHKQVGSDFRCAVVAWHGAQTESGFLTVIFSVRKDDSTGTQLSQVLPERNPLSLVRRHSPSSSPSRRQGLFFSKIKFSYLMNFFCDKLFI